MVSVKYELISKCSHHVHTHKTMYLHLPVCSKIRSIAFFLRRVAFLERPPCSSSLSSSSSDATKVSSTKFSILVVACTTSCEATFDKSFVISVALLEILLRSVCVVTSAFLSPYGCTKEISESESYLIYVKRRGEMRMCMLRQSIMRRDNYYINWHTNMTIYSRITNDLPAVRGLPSWFVAHRVF